MADRARRFGWTLILAGILACVAFSVRAEPEWVCGSEWLSRRLGSFDGGDSAASAPPKIGAPARFAVGDQRDFFAFDFTTSRQYSVTATLRAVGDLCYVYVADDQWNARVASDDANALLDAFEHRAPADSRRGIYQIETEAFGDPPDVDGDPRIVLLLLDIRDGFKSGGAAFVAGYFTDINERAGVVRDARWGIQFQSNETEMLYLDTYPGFANVRFTSSILAHEFQHLLHYGLDPREEVWVNEGCSELAMFLCGYPPSEHVRSFESSPTVSLTDWSGDGIGGALPYYGSVYLWMLYLYERFGGLPAIRSIARDARTGVDGVDAVLRARGAGTGFRSAFLDWRTALIADDSRFEDGRFGFENADANLDRTRHRAYPVSPSERTLSGWAGDALSFDAVVGESLPLQLEAAASGADRASFAARALLFAGERLVETRDFGANAGGGRFSGALSGFGDAFDNVVFSVVNAPVSSAGTEIAYVYSARLGAAVSFRLTAFRNPIQREYVEVVATPDAPVETGDVLLRLARGETRLSAPMRSTNGGKTFTAAFRATDAAGEWSWELEHFEQSVGSGAFQIAP